MEEVTQNKALADLSSEELIALFQADKKPIQATSQPNDFMSVYSRVHSDTVSTRQKFCQPTEEDKKVAEALAIFNQPNPQKPEIQPYQPKKSPKLGTKNKITQAKQQILADLVKSAPVGWGYEQLIDEFKKLIQSQFNETPSRATIHRYFQYLTSTNQLQKHQYQKRSRKLAQLLEVILTLPPTATNLTICNTFAYRYPLPDSTNPMRRHTAQRYIDDFKVLGWFSKYKNKRIEYSTKKNSRKFRQKRFFKINKSILSSAQKQIYKATLSAWAEKRGWKKLNAENRILVIPQYEHLLDKPRLLKFHVDSDVNFQEAFFASKALKFIQPKIWKYIPWPMIGKVDSLIAKYVADPRSFSASLAQKIEGLMDGKRRYLEGLNQFNQIKMHFISNLNEIKQADIQHYLKLNQGNKWVTPEGASKEFATKFKQSKYIQNAFVNWVKAA